MRIFLSILFTFSFIVTCQASTVDVIEHEIPNKPSPKKRSKCVEADAVPVVPKFAPTARSAFSLINLFTDEVLDEDDDAGPKPAPKSKPSPKKRLNCDEGAKIPPLSPSKRGKAAVQVAQFPALEVLPTLILDSLMHRKPSILIATKGTTVVFVDLDRTLVQHRLMFYDLEEGMQNEVLASFYNNDNFDGSEDEFALFKEYLSATHNFFSEYSRQLDESYVEPGALAYFSELRANGALIIGLTARKYLIADQTDQSLRRLGFNFAELSGLGDMTYTSSAYRLQNGICYTGNAVRKARIIPSILNTIVNLRLHKEGPYTTYHYDDSEIEIGAFSPENPPLNITPYRVTVQPFHYLAYERGTEPKVIRVYEGDHNAVHQEIDEELVYGGFIPWLQKERGLEY